MAMARSAILVVAAMAALAVQLAAAADHPVGGTGSWDTSNGAGFYNKWASKTVFKLGDTLTFKYPAGHDVTEVGKPEYDACSGAKPIKTFSDGDTTVKLPTAGKRYFICSVPGHCAAGMKLEVTVVAAAATKPGGRHQRSVAPTPAPAPEPSSTETSTPAPAPKASDAASIMLGGNKQAVLVGLAAGVAMAALAM
nr:unnamed protein product [Digitaria exilis]